MKVRIPKIYPKVVGVWCYLCVECGQVHAMYLDKELLENDTLPPESFPCPVCKGLCGHMPPEHKLDRQFSERELNVKGQRYFRYTKEGIIPMEVK